MCYKSTELFYSLPTQAFGGQCFYCTNLSQLLLGYPRFLSQFHEKQHTFMFPLEMISCPLLNFIRVDWGTVTISAWQDKLSFCTSRGLEAFTYHTQQICCFQEADLLHMHSTVWLSPQLHYTHSSVQNQTVCTHFVYTCIFYPEKTRQKHVRPGLGILCNEVKKFRKQFLHENPPSSRLKLVCYLKINM